MSSADRSLPDDPFDRVIRRAAGRHLGPDPCPDASELAALIEGTLSSKERTALETHAADCGRCAAELAALARLPADDPRPLPAAAGSSTRLWGWRWAVPLATAVVVFAVWSETRRESVPVAPAPAATSDGRVRPSEPPSSPRTVTLGGAKADAPPAAETEQRVESRRKEAPLIGGARASAPEREDANQERTFEAAPAAPTTDAVPAPAAPARELKRDRQSFGREAAAERDARDSAPQSARPLRDAAQNAGAVAESSRPHQPTEGSPSSGLASAERLSKVESTPVAVPSGGRPAPLVIRASTAVWVRIGGSAIERSTDAGRTWRTERQLGGSEVVAGICPSDDVCWLAGSRGLVLRRDPSGTWTDVSPPAAGGIERIEAVDASRATVTTVDGVRLTTADGGQSWSPAH